MENMKKELVVQIKYENEVYYIMEPNPYTVNGFILTKSIQKAQLYFSVYEFLVALKYIGFSYKTKAEFNDFNHFLNTAVFKIVNKNTLRTRKFDINKKVSFTKKQLYFSKKEFNNLKRCFYSSSHYMYDKNNNRIAFPEKDDIITSMVYLKRGLLAVIDSMFEYRNSHTPSCYSGMEKNTFTMRNLDILKLALDDDIDSCYRIKVYSKK